MDRNLTDQRLRTELLLAVMRMAKTAVWVNTFIALGVAAAVASLVDPLFWLWFAILLPFNLLRLPVSRKAIKAIERDRRKDIDVQAWRYWLLTIGSGLTWGFGAFATELLGANAGLQNFVVTTAILIAAGSHATLAVVRSMHVGFVLSILVPIICFYVVMGFNSWATLASGAFLLVYTYFITNSGKAYVQELRGAHMLRFEYEDLARDLAESRDEIHAGRERLRVTFAAIEEAIITADEGLCIDYVNGAAERLLGVDRLNLVGMSLEKALKLSSQSGHDLSGALAERLREDDKSWFSQGFRLAVGGRNVDIEVSASLIRSAGGQLIGSVLVLHDSSALRDLNRRMSYEATHDPLTSLKNRRGFNAALMAATSDRASQYTLCYLDLDNFKRINDVSGHGAGDKVLTCVADAMQEQLRDADVLARVGGDEFALLLRGCTPADAEPIVERLRLAVSGVVYEHNNVVYTLGVSIGMVGLMDYATPEMALEAADAACYAVKQSSRRFKG